MLWVSGRGCVCVCLPGCSGLLMSDFLGMEGCLGGAYLGFHHLLQCIPDTFLLPGCPVSPPRSFLWNKSFGWIFAVVLSWEVCPGEQGVPPWHLPPQWGWHFVQLHVGAQCVSLPSLVLQEWGNSPQNVFKMLLNAFISWQMCIFWFWRVCDRLFHRMERFVV